MSVSLNDKPNKVYTSGDTVTVTTGSGIQGPQGATGPTGAGGTVAYYGNFFSTETQNNAGATSVNTFTLNSTVDANGISIVDSTKITFAAGSDGTYDLQFSVQFDKTDSGTDEVDVWLSKNGNYEAWSNTTLSLVGNNAKVVAAWNFQLNDVVGGDYFELHWWSPDTAVRALAAAAGSNPTRPAVPSIIVTVAQVTYTQAGPEGGTSTLTTKGDLLTRTTSAVARLPVGATNGHVLTVDSAEATGMKWAASSGGIPETLIDAKGDLIVGSAADTAARLAVGTVQGQVLKVNSAATNGVEWGSPVVAPALIKLSTGNRCAGMPSWSFNVANVSTFAGGSGQVEYLAFSVHSRIIVTAFCSAPTGATSGNLAMGIYPADTDGLPSGDLVVGAEAVYAGTGASFITNTVTDTTLNPGRYVAAYRFSNGTTSRRWWTFNTEFGPSQIAPVSTAGYMIVFYADGLSYVTMPTTPTQPTKQYSDPNGRNYTPFVIQWKLS